MGVFAGVVPFTTSSQTFLVAGVLVSVKVGLDGKPVATITVGDPWEIVTERLPLNEFAERTNKVKRAIAAWTDPGTIACTQGCQIIAEAAYNEAIKNGASALGAKLAAEGAWADCIDRCAGQPPR
jgi:hypothetical protein